MKTNLHNCGAMNPGLMLIKPNITVFEDMMRSYYGDQRYITVGWPKQDFFDYFYGDHWRHFNDFGHQEEHQYIIHGRVFDKPRSLPTEVLDAWEQDAKRLSYAMTMLGEVPSFITADPEYWSNSPPPMKHSGNHSPQHLASYINTGGELQ